MYRHLWILPDGTEVFSGAEQENVLRSVKVTQSVNSGTELTLGSACSAMMEAELITPGGGLVLSAGDRITLYRVYGDQTREKMGVYWLEEPVRPTADTMKVTAFDAVSRLDQDMTQWLTELDQWPYTVEEFADLVCSQCGVELVQTILPNGEFYIRPFTGQGITGRQLVQWIGQITGRFCRATAEGKVEFAWYVPNETTAITPTGEAASVFYYQGQLSYEDYQIAPIEKVQLRQTSEDVGTVWPDEAGEKNTYIIENNPMLAVQDSGSLIPVAQTLYEHLAQVSFTPCQVTIPATPEIRAGHILSVTDLNGKQISVYVMQKVSDGQQDTIFCTGSYRRDSSAVVNNQDYRALSGKVLNLRTDVEGIKAENKDTQGNLAAVQLDLEGIRSRVENQEVTSQGLCSSISALEQTSRSFSLELTDIRQNGTDKVKTTQGYTFDDEGLHISRSDSDMENTLDHTGMYVKRGEETVLQANNLGVIATDVTVHNFLTIGHARFEEYSSGADSARTACFFV